MLGFEFLKENTIEFHSKKNPLKAKEFKKGSSRGTIVMFKNSPLH